MIFIEEGEINR